MIFKTTNIKGLVEIFPRILEDERGIFFETFQQKLFLENGVPSEFVQDNQSFSRKGVLRGLHFQKKPYEQGKLVRVITGKVLDIAVDIREDSSTFGRYVGVILDSRLNNMLYVPEGFAHGFVALEDSIFSYKCTNFYNKAAESGIIWNDKQLNIDWGISNPVVSEKDQALPLLREVVIA
ncbi:dTDP-4-dehydrorhamnose 3,5-epimerase [Rhodocytophaga rosea]|uniref:dTDP-4-dehydrorhamnose 3,5-epimerase n=1 Tax=Rhodocytophaga rosea TaxID=2704465 RepID=A0A6C0GJD7_9BACT|nr:dTDP-4-dehydrorhamnose 3,5-epimerase [Rhodocytophaga rosea]QHT68095.1 dTDP-4-dehydrorhamnose 3,5-epimerase [Rhodocytophaga rosea]